MGLKTKIGLIWRKTKPWRGGKREKKRRRGRGKEEEEKGRGKLSQKGMKLCIDLYGTPKLSMHPCFCLVNGLPQT